MTLNILFFVIMAAIFSCQKKANKRTSQNTEKDTAGVNESSGESIQISGQIEISQFPSSSSPNSIFVLGGSSRSSSQANGYSSALNIDASGSFSTELAKSSNKSNLLDDDSDSAPVYLLTAAATEDLGALESGELSLSDRQKIADSFTYISLPTDGSSLSGYPADSIKGNLNLGNVGYTEGEEDATAELSADTDVFDFSSETISLFSTSDDTLKSQKNTFINPDISAEPFYLFKYQLKSSAENQFNQPENSTYSGYGFYIGVGNPKFTYEQICDTNNSTRHLIELVPPATVNAGTTYGQRSPNSPFNNGGITQSTQNGRRMCNGSETGFYAREDVFDGQTSFMLNWGTGGSILESIPQGYWYLKYRGEKLGAFELASSGPLNAKGKPIIFIPTFNVGTSGTGISTVKLKFHVWNSTNEKYEVLADTTIIDQMVKELYFSADSDSGEYRYSMKNPVDGVYSVAGNTLDADETTRLDSIVRSNLRAYAVSYKIGSITFRWDMRDNY